MRLGRILVLRIRSLMRRNRAEAELQRELELHLEELTKEYAASGMSASEARLAARRDFGSMDLMEEQCRDTRRVSLLEDLARDLAYAMRLLRKSPGFALTAVLSLGLGIGANTAVFTLLQAILLRPLPVAEPERLVQFGNTIPLWDTGSDSARSLFSYPQFEDFRTRSQAMSGIFGGLRIGAVSVGVRGSAGMAQADAYSGSFFTVLGIAPQAGRFYSDSDDNAVAVISDRYWRRRFGSGEAIVGSVVTINQIPFTVIGITPPEFLGIAVGSCPDVWVPLRALDRLKPDRERWSEPLSTWMLVAGRLRPGISREQAQAEADVIRRQFLTESLAHSKLREQENLQRAVRDGRLVLRPAATGMDSWLREAYALPLKLLMGVAGIVLLAACANIANLLLARAANRRREIAMRLALGAGRGRLVRQLLAESTLLALLGGALAVPMAWWGSAALVGMISTGDARIPLAVTPDWRVFAFAAAISLITGILFGLAPAIRGTRIAGEGRSHALDRALVIAQVALSVMLVAGAGLFVRTLQKLWSVPVGYDRQNVLMLAVDARLAGYPQERSGAVYREVLRRLQALPGVKSASASVVRPEEDMFNLVDRVNEVDGRQVSENAVIRVAWNAVSPGYFATVTTPLVAGRDFDERDSETAPKTVIVNESLAARAFPGESALGHRVGLATVVGVVADAHYAGAREQAGPVLYHPLFQFGPDQVYGWGYVSYEVRYASLSNLLAEVRREVGSVDRNLPVFRVRTLVAQTEEALLTERLLAMLSSFFGGLALLLACVGLYGLMAYAVARRTGEIGIRLALGARRGQIVWLVLRETLWLGAAGIVVGVALAVWAAGFAKSLLYGVNGADPVTIAVTVGILIAVGAVAAWMPARRALRVDPVVALRNE